MRALIFLSLLCTTAHAFEERSDTFFAPPPHQFTISADYFSSAFNYNTQERISEQKESYSLSAFYSFNSRLSTHLKATFTNRVRDRRIYADEHFIGFEDLEWGWQALTPIHGVHLMYGADIRASLARHEEPRPPASGNNYTGTYALLPFIGFELPLPDQTPGLKATFGYNLGYVQSPDDPVPPLSRPVTLIEVFDELFITHDVDLVFAIGAGKDENWSSEQDINLWRVRGVGVFKFNPELEARIGIAQRMISGDSPFAETMIEVGGRYIF